MQRVSLADSTGSFFTLKNVQWTQNPITNTPFKITGKVDLFGIPWIIPPWVIAYITYPRRSIGPIPIEPFPPIAHAGVVAWFGNFTINFPKGFEREGEYTIDLKMFLGPTFAQSAGPITSVVVTQPPFAPVTTLLSQKFTVTQGGAQNTFTFLAPTINGTTKPHLNPGADITIVWPVRSNFTEAVTVESGQLTIYDDTLLNLGTGALVANIAVPGFTIQPGETRNITIKYKADAAFHPKDIRLGLTVQGSIFTSDWIDDAYYVENFSLTLGQPMCSPNPANIGETVTIKCPVTNGGTSQALVDITVAVAEAGFLWTTGSPIMTRIIPNVSIAPGATYQATVTYVAAPGGPLNSSGQYGRVVGVRIAVAGTNQTSYEKTFDDAFFVTARVLGLTITNSPIQTGGTLQWTWSGFMPNQPINFVAQGTNLSVTLTSNANGGGSGSAVVNAAAGQYYLQASDQAGDTKLVAFTVTVPPSNPAVNVTNSPVQSGTAVQFSWSGFVPNQTINFVIQGTQVPGTSVISLTSDANGAGTGSTTVVAAAGQYRLQASDLSGHSAYAMFDVTGVTPPIPRLSVTNSPVLRGSQVQFNFSGFLPNQTVYVLVQGTAVQMEVTSSAQGTGSGSMVVDIPAGTYTMSAADVGGDDARTTFEVTGGGGGTPTLTIYNSPIALGNQLNFGWTGFEPNQNVVIWVPGVAAFGWNRNSDSLGSWQGWTPINQSNGFAPGQTYTLYVMDAYGHQAHADFATTGGGNPPNLVVTNSPVQLGLSAFFSLANFTPNSQVDVWIETTGVSVNAFTDSNGNGSGALYLSPNQLTPGDWVLLAQDGQGLQAEAPLTIVY